VVFDDSPFKEYNPFNLQSDLKKLSINDSLLLEIKIKLEEELEKGGPRKDALRCICGSIVSIFVSDIRCSDEHGGKSSGYRVFVLIVPDLKRGYVLGIIRHHHKQQDTSLSRHAKNQFREIVKQVESLMNLTKKEKNYGHRN